MYFLFEIFKYAIIIFTINMSGAGLNQKYGMRVPLSWRRKTKTVKSNLQVEKLILKCINEAFEELGSSVAQALFFHLENNFGLRKREISKKPKHFLKALKSIFGEEGAKTIEKLCIKKLELEFNLTIDEGIGLINAIRIIKQHKIKFDSTNENIKS